MRIRVSPVVTNSTLTLARSPCGCEKLPAWRCHQYPTNLSTSRRCSFGRSVRFQEEMPNLIALPEHEVSVRGNPYESFPLPGNRDSEPDVLSLAPGHEFGVWRLAERKFENAPKVRDHEVVRKEPLCPTGIGLLPTQWARLRAWRGRHDGAVSLKGVRTLQLQPIRDERCAGIKFHAHPLAAAVSPEVAVVEESLESPGDLLIGATDERPDVPAFEVAITVDNFEDLDVAARQGELAVPLTVAAGLRDELTESRGSGGCDGHGVRW